ncbi:MAG: adenylosuccinate lyase [Clostridiales bacterium]|jgi:adenylosuccinate lyase|nr:adenylosuccinate lyase [Clostridiales bacterium]
MSDNYEKRDKYESPLRARYAGREMLEIFSDDRKFRTWRKLWIALAEAEAELGLPVTAEQIAELKAAAEDINYEAAAAYERETRHDVMAHVRAYGDLCPKAAGIIHLGATSCYVGDNTDLILMREALRLIRRKLLTVIKNLRGFAARYKEMPSLAFTHFQPAQLTTVGKRACLWLHELLMDLDELDFTLENLKFLGSKGTTGTQASFMELFGGDDGKVKRLEEIIAAKFGFERVYPVSGQTYSRKADSRVLNALSQIAQSAYKFSGDMRLLQHLKEIEEPFEKGQVGSSAMAYKRNPMRSERIAALCRHIISLAQNGAHTAAAQWFERTLDDSANKRITIPEAFLAADGVLSLYINITGGLVVYPKMIRRRIDAELPFMATENILMAAVRRGGDRQELHEKIRVHSQAAAARVKDDGGENDLIDRIAADPAFGISREEIEETMRPENYTGRSAAQVDEFLRDYADPALSGLESLEAAEINV